MLNGKVSQRGNSPQCVQIQRGEHVDFTEPSPAMGKEKMATHRLEEQVVVIQAADLVQSYRTIKDLKTWAQLTWQWGYLPTCTARLVGLSERRRTGNSSGHPGWSTTKISARKQQGIPASHGQKWGSVYMPSVSQGRTTEQDMVLNLPGSRPRLSRLSLHGDHPRPDRRREKKDICFYDSTACTAKSAGFCTALQAGVNLRRRWGDGCQGDPVES